MFAVGENIWKQAKPPVLFDSSRSASVMLGWHVQQNETNLIITEPGHESIAPQPVFKPMQNNSPSLQPALIKPLSLAHFHQRIHTEATSSLSVAEMELPLSSSMHLQRHQVHKPTFFERTFFFFLKRTCSKKSSEQSHSFKSSSHLRPAESAFHYSKTTSIRNSPFTA